jgi:hypothetical protein
LPAMYKTRNNVYFIIAVLMLASCAGWLQAKSSAGTLRLIKKPLPIRKPLIDLDRSAMSPFEVVKAERLSPEIVENLGTQEYLTWVLVSRAKSEARPIQLSVTYYTGVQDQVPHVPEECLYQGGMTQDTDDTLNLHLPRLGEDVSVRRLSFRSPRQVGVRSYVYYTICVNGTFCSDRTTARFRMGNLTDSHLYYSKVELALDGSGDVDLTVMNNRAVEVLDRALTELRKSHWPPKGSERGPGAPVSPAADAAMRP